MDSKFVTTIFKLSDKAGKKWEKFENTKTGKAVRHVARQEIISLA